MKKLIGVLLVIIIALIGLAACANDSANNNGNSNPSRNIGSGNVNNFEKYDVIFLGYPIWFSQAPKIIYTFLESYDFSGKTIVPFCTSGSSGVGSSATNLQSLAKSADWIKEYVKT